MNEFMIFLICGVIAALVAAIVCLLFRLRDRRETANTYHPAPGRCERNLASYRNNGKDMD